MTALSGSNLSILDQDGHIWMPPAGLEKGHVGTNDYVASLQK